MTPDRRTPLTLLAALLLGAALGLLATGEKPPSSSSLPATAEGAGTAARGNPSPPPRAGRESTSARLPAGSTAAAYSAAWELLLDRELPRDERTTLASALLEEWCLVDLRAALHAAFSDGRTDSDDPFAPDALDSCSKGIEQQPDLAWELCESQEYGLHTRRLRETWIVHTGVQDPLRLLDRYSLLPAERLEQGRAPRDAAIRMALVGSLEKNADPKLAEAVLAKLVALAEEGDREKIVSAAAAFLPQWLPAERNLESLRAAQSPVDREIYLKAYAGLVQSHLDIGQLEKLDQIPADLRAEVLPLLRLPEPAPEE